MDDPAVRTAQFADLDALTLYRLLQLRSKVFVVEQSCPYNDLDGRDIEPGTWHVWAADDDGIPVAYLRMLEEPDGQLRIGRVVTAIHARGRGLAGHLLAAALEVLGERPAVLHAQSYATDLYAKYGFEISGPEFDEDGIPHVPMRRPPTPPIKELEVECSASFDL